MSLRVLVSGVVFAQPMGGVRRHAAEVLPRVARRLAAEGGSLSILEGREGLPFALPAEVERIASRVPASPALVRATLEGRALRAAILAARQAGRPFDVVHSGHLPVPRGIGVARCHLIHDLRALELAHTPLSRRLVAGKVIGAAVEGARAVVAVSARVRESLLARFRLAPERVFVAPNAADHFTPLPRERRPDAPLLHVGHLEPRKNLALVVRALSLDAALPPLFLAGAPKGGEEERLRALADELGVADRVRFLGPFEDRELAGLYARAACVVLPSRLEGFGIPALEARRASVPLAASREGAVDEAAGDAPRFSADDPADCARAIRAALSRSAAELEAERLAADLPTWDASAARLFEAWRAAASV